MGGIEVQIFLVPISESYSENEVLKSRYSLDRKGTLGTCHCSRIILCVPGRKALESNRHLYPLRPPRPRRYDQRRRIASSHCLNVLCLLLPGKIKHALNFSTEMWKWSREADVHRHSWVKTFLPWTFQALQLPGVRSSNAFRPKWLGNWEDPPTAGSGSALTQEDRAQRACSLPSRDTLSPALLF